MGYSKIASLKKAVHASEGKSTFGVKGFEDHTTGTVSVSMSLKPQAFDLPMDVQKGNWQSLEDSSPMKAMGFKQWKSAKGGIAFQHEKGGEVQCNAADGTSEPEGLQIHFACKPSSMRFKATAKSDVDVVESAWTETGSSHMPFGWETQWGEYDY